MAATKESIENISLDKSQTNEIIHRVSRMALLDGAQGKISKGTLPETVQQLPFTLFPSVLPANVLEEATRLQPHYQTLMYKVANDHEFLYECLKEVLKVDDFTQKLWEIYETVRREGVTQDISLLIIRNDYMLGKNENVTCDNPQIKQVEINTFASGGAGISTAMREIHKYSLKIAGVPFKEEQFPENMPIAGIARGLVTAWEYYKNDSSAILFVVDFEEYIMPDQIWVEREILKVNRNITVMYRTIDQLVQQHSLGSSKELHVGSTEIAVVYYRHGFSPEHYPTETGLNLRLQIERSRAIKCPNIAGHLAGCKKIQQVLSSPGVLERFIDDRNVVAAIRATFVGQFNLDQTNITKALSDPNSYVLKPQREGGGNNLFGEAIRRFLEKKKDPVKLSDWIMMDRIQTIRQRNRLVNSGVKPECRDVESELGIYGIHIGSPSQALFNYQCGYLVRTKLMETTEGGIIHGESCYDSVLLPCM